jgi:hypothetical protein
MTREAILRGIFERGVEARRSDLPRDLRHDGIREELIETWRSGWDAEDAAIRAADRVAIPGEILRGKVLRTGGKRRSISPFPSRAEPDDFLPSSEDIRVAQETGQSVRVSVFETGRTTIDQCRAIRQVGVEVPIFSLAVERLRAVVAPGRNQCLRVVEDLLPPPVRFMPGADGHCGIEGLDRPAGCSRLAYRSILSELVGIAIIAT